MFTLMYAPSVTLVLAVFLGAAYLAVPTASGAAPAGALTPARKRRGFTVLTGGAVAAVLSSLLTPGSSAFPGGALLAFAGLLLFFVVILLCTALLCSGLYRRAARRARGRGRGRKHNTRKAHSQS